MSAGIRIELPDGSTYGLQPQYNLRLFYPRIVEEAMKGLKKSVWEPWYEPQLRAAGVTEKELLEGWLAYASMMGACLSLEQTSPVDALTACGFLNVRPEVMWTILAKIGQLVTANIWWPLREGTHVGDEPSDVKDIVQKMKDLMAEKGCAS